MELEREVTVCVKLSDLGIVLGLARKVLHTAVRIEDDYDDTSPGLEYSQFDYTASIGAIDKALHNAHEK